MSFSPILKSSLGLFARTLVGTRFLWLTLAAAAAAAVPDFTFLQVSDIHTPMPQSQVTISNLQYLRDIDLKPFGVRAAAPSFVIATGDLTEFGGGNGWWETYVAYWRGNHIPVYNQLGNHDNTWHANIKPLRESGRSPCYSFDQFGCHFVGLMTPTPQDPRPSLGEEEILWLQQDLAKTGRSKPVFVFFHHPLPGSEFASRYDYDRLLDVLHGYNTVLLMAGHSHGHVHRLVQGIDQVTGGSTFGPNTGQAVLAVKDGILRVAYWKAGQEAPDEKLLEKPLPTDAPFPVVDIVSPGFRDVVSASLALTGTLSGASEVEAATYTIDDELKGDLALSGTGSVWRASGSVDLSRLLPGAHYLRLDFAKGNQHYTRSTHFFSEPPDHPTAWRAYLAASSKVTPTLAEGVLYVGANDGRLRALNAVTGQELWVAETGAEILAQPLVDHGQVISANGLGVVSAYSKTGTKLWSFTASDAVYSSPVMAEGRVVFGCNDGKLYALDPNTGKPAWTNFDATYTIESKPFVAGGKIYYGAWDEYVHCVNAKDGTLAWKRQSEGVRLAKAAKRYYSPADAMPVVAEGKLMIADRNYQLSILDSQTGERIGALPKVAATGLSEDGKCVYLRQTDGRLAKIDSSAKEIWSVPAHLGAIPAAPTEKNGVVYVASGTGLVSALTAESGKVLWQYQASPQLFVMSSLACDGTNVYVTAFDGTLTAIRCRPQ